MASSLSGMVLIAFLSLFFLGVIIYIAWKIDRLRWLLWLLPVLLVGAIFSLAYNRDHDFWRSTYSLCQECPGICGARRPGSRLGVGPEGLGPGPE